jgi:hypothetical protein
MIGVDGRGLTKEESSKSPLGTEISTEENSNCRRRPLGTKRSSWGMSWERERNYSRTKESYVGYENRFNWSDWYAKLV